MADQAAVSLGNFFTNIILARHLLPRQYGSYAILLGVLLFLYGLHNAFVVYPLSVRGAPAGEDDLRRLTFFSVCLSTGVGLIFGVGVLVGGWGFHQTPLASVAALALLFWIIQETLRRALMAHLQFSRAIWGDLISYLGQAVCLLFLGRAGRLTPERVFGVMAATSLAAALLQTIQVGICFASPRQMYEMLRVYWGLGRWLLLSALVSVFSIQFFPWLLAWLRGTAAAGAFQALVNITGVTNPILISTASLIVPASAKAWREHGIPAASRVARNYGIQSGVLIFPYLFLVLLWPHRVLTFLYGPASSYVVLTSALRVLVAAHFVYYVTVVQATLLNAIEQSRTNFVVLVGSALVSLVFGGALVAWLGLLGAVAATGLSTLFRAGMLWAAVRKQTLFWRCGNHQCESLS